MAIKSKHLQIRVTPAQKRRLRTLAGDAGQDLSSYVLSRVLPDSQERFEELLMLLHAGEDQRYVLAELNELLASLGSEELPTAVVHADLEGMSAFLRNYVAAMVELACHLKGVDPPRWTARVAPLETPYFAAPLVSLRLHLLRSSPVPFKRRNLFVDATVGARV